MSPRSTKASNGATSAKGEEKVPSSRRSTRLAGEKVPDVDGEADVPSGVRKRPASSTNSTSNKKSKPASKSKTKSNGKASAGNKSKKELKAAETIDEAEEGEGEGGDAGPEEKKGDSYEAEAGEDKAEEEKAEEEKEEEAPPKAKPTGKTLKLGDKLPKLMLKDEEGSEVDVSGLAGEKGLVVFLYPKADTPGCTSQACGFRDAFDEIAEHGYEIYGLSKDTPAAQKKWKNGKKLNYHLLSDPDSQLIKRLGAFVMPKNTKRSHFIFEKGTGKLVDIDIGVKPATDPANVLKFLKKHHLS